MPSSCSVRPVMNNPRTFTTNTAFVVHLFQTQSSRQRSVGSGDHRNERCLYHPFRVTKQLVRKRLGKFEHQPYALEIPKQSSKTSKVSVGDCLAYRKHAFFPLFFSPLPFLCMAALRLIACTCHVTIELCTSPSSISSHISFFLFGSLWMLLLHP